MVVQAIALLDDLDKEINIYAMRVKVRKLRLSLFSDLRSVGMVRLAFPRNDQDSDGQHRLCQNGPVDGYALMIRLASALD